MFIKNLILLLSFSGDPLGHFSLSEPSQNTVRLITNTKLDFEAIRQYNLIIRATNEDEPNFVPGTYEAFVNYRINVRDLNDNPPVFTQSLYSYSHPENIPNNTIIGKVEAKDGDSNPFSFSLEGQISGNLFYIQPDGTIRNKVLLDRETADVHTFFVTVTDDSFSSVAEVVVNVTDVNDNRPIFVDSAFDILVTEAALVGRAIIRATATDIDLGTNAEIIYNIVSGNDQIKFQINALTGDISLRTPLDYEVAPTVYNLVVRATDRGTPSTLSSNPDLPVTIRVADNNDNNPAFVQSLYQKDITESQALNVNIGLQVSATDADGTEINNRLTYSLKGAQANEFFLILPDGNIMLRKQLNAVTNPEFRFSVEASDGSLTSSRHRTAEVLIRVSDTNNLQPVISPNPINILISEGTSVGTLIGQVKATDGDSVGTLTYTAKGAQASRFLVNPNTGEISLNTDLDREDVNLRTSTFQVDVKDGVFTSTATITVTVTDRNDNEPRFTQQYYEATYPENVASTVELVRVTATDIDENLNALIVYSIETDPKNDSPDLFQISSTTGVITRKANAELDYETQKKHQFKVVATDSGTLRQLSGYATVVINLQDVNDNDPTFIKQAYTINLKESHSLSEPLASMQATDADQAKDLTFFITSPASTPFQFVGKEMVLIRSLDYEQVQSYTLKVRARDVGGRTSAAEATVTVNVIEVNDNRPVFTQQYVRVEVDENVALNTLITTLTASDADSGPLTNNIRFVSLSNTTEFALNIISGEVSNRVLLDYERQSLYSLVAKVEDLGQPSLSSIMHLDIVVRNVNDERPIWSPASYTNTISEKAPIGTTVAVLRATDADTLTSALRFGAIQGNPHFALNPVTGAVTLAEQLDSDVARDTAFVMSYYVTDGAFNTTSGTVQITVADRNDNEPVFEVKEYVVYFNENQVAGTDVVVVAASDPDVTVNNLLFTYSIVPSQDANNFTMTGNQIKSAVSFDYDQGAKKYSFEVQAVNANSEDKLSGKAMVTVFIIDLNDNNPIALPESLTFNISEGTIVGSVVNAIHATDLDSTNNGELTYTAVDQTQTFVINDEGVLILNKQLDARALNRYQFTVIVSDKGQPTRSDTVQVLANVLPVTLPGIRIDNCPRVLEFNENSLNVIEGNMQLSATDTGSYKSTTFTYSVVAGQNEIQNQFAVTQTGAIAILRAQDYETRNRYEILVRAANERGAEAFCFVTFAIRDVNERPLFNPNTYVVSVPENTSPNTVIYSVLATDPDFSSSVNGQLSYTLGLAGTSIDMFKIDQVGRISLDKDLDYESANKRYQFTVTATDKNVGNPLSTVATVIVDVTDWNDNHPSIILPNNGGFTVNEAQIGNVLGVLQATDEDSGINKGLQWVGIYPQGTLSINSAGVVSVTKAFDYEKQQQHKFVVEVRDTGSPYLTSTAVFTVDVLNVNDNTPYFPNQNYTISVSEASPIGTTVLGIMADDDDLGDNGVIQNYAILSGNQLGRFSITPQGFITVANDLDLDKVNAPSTITLEVLAMDKGTPQRNSTVHSYVTINIVEHLDKQPFFTQPSYIITIPENTTFATTIQSFTASSSESNSNLIFSAANGGVNQDSNSFLVTRTSDTSGTIQTRALFDYETKRFYSFEILVTDTLTQKTGKALVVVRITDVNDNVPIIAGNVVHNITENTLIGSVVASLDGSDQDDGINRLFDFSATGGDDKFTMLADGNVILKNHLNADEKTVHQLSVTLRDRGNPSLASNGLITFYVHRAIANVVCTPGVIRENANPGASVTQVIGVDPNTLSSDGFTYSIVGGITQSMFSINSTTGQITVRNPTLIDFEAQTTHNIAVLAKGPTSTGVGSCLVTIQDDNDNRPQFTASSYNLVLYENLYPGQRLLQVHADDADSTLSGNNLVRYELVTSTDSPLFAVNSLTGVVTVPLGGLDNEAAKTLYTITVTARDSGTPSLTAINDVTIILSIQDRNDRFPIFGKALYQGSVAENQQAGFSILRVTATDSDRTTVNNQVRYSINQTLASQYFTVNAISGEIRIKSNLDYETHKRFDFAVFATDNGAVPFVRHTNVEIRVTDIVETRVSFQPTDYNITIPESTPIGTSLVLLQVAEKTNGLNFQFIDGHLDDRFLLNPTTGEMSLKNPVDREQKSFYLMRASVSDPNVGAGTNTATIRVTITDVNDNVPTFTNGNTCYRQTVVENTPANTQVTNVIATDRDQGNNAKFDFAFNPPCPGFAMSATGSVTTTGVLDHELKKEYTCQLRVTDKGTPSLSSSTCMVITVVDTNDNTPRFEKSVYNETVKESALVNRIITRVWASDADSNAFNTFDFSLDPTSNTNVDFKIDNSGFIRINQALDYDKKQQGYTLLVRATDRNDRTRVSTATVFVTVEETNDNRPVFDKFYYKATVSERSNIGTAVLELKATDADRGVLESRLIFVALENTTDFTLEQTTGVISVAKPLDYETKKEYHLVATVVDSGTPALQTRTLVDIIVEDANDHAPVFSPFIYNSIISEKAPLNMPVVTVSAADADSGTNGQITYELLNGEEKFTINADTGLISVSGDLNMEATSKQLYQLTVRATDKASPNPRSSTNNAIVSVTVTDVNDRQPVFQQSSYVFSVDELRQIGWPVGLVSASDGDFSSPRNSLSYRIVPSTDAGNFSLAGNQITTAVTFDIKDKSSYSFEMEAFDAASKSEDVLRGKALVTIIINDINNNPPKPNQALIILNISDVTMIGTVLTNVLATDADQGRNAELRYSMVGDFTNEFRIDNSGALTLQRTLDSSIKNKYSLNVSVTDNGVTPLTSKVRVIVNVHPLELGVITFTPACPLTFVVAEGSSSGNLGNIVAVDSSAVSSKVTFAMASSISDLEGKLVVGRDGSIYLIGLVDYETRPRYDFMTCASNSRGFKACCFVTVFVRDVNERPTFKETQYIVDIPETTPKGMNILTVEALDPDLKSSINSKHNFTLVNDNGAFTIDEYGRIRTNLDRLDVETTSIYSFRAKVTDNGDPNYSAETNIIVRITDYNDNRPIVIADNITVLENRTGVVGVIKASDSDISQDNRNIQFSIKPEGILSVDPVSGVLQVVGNLDYEKYQSYEFLAIATDKRNDQTSPYLTGIKTFYLNIGNVNDNTPYFVTPNFEVTISEKSVVGTPVVQLYAQDDDLPVYGTIQNYIITSGNANNAFTINNKGELTTDRTLSYPADQKFTLTVVASDGERTSPVPATVIVNIADYRDLQPYFLSNYYVVMYPEDTPVNSPIVKVQATTNEVVKAPLTYTIINRNPDTNSFRIDANSGEISNTLPFNYEQRTNYTFDVEVTDTQNLKTNRASVVVIILDVNDVGPGSLSAPTTVNITEFTLVGSTVAAIRADDLESKQNGVVMYRIVGGTGKDVFGISKETGIITLRQDIYHDKTKFYTLAVEAYNPNPGTTQPSPGSINIYVHTAYTTVFGVPGNVLENSPAGTFVTQVSSVDAYNGNSIGMRYYLVGQSNTFFRINETTGRITVGQGLDRESQSQHRLIVQSKGPTSTAVGEISVTILDQNDNSPRFTAGAYSIVVSEATTVGTTLYRVVAEDADITPNNNIVYSLDSGDSSMFRVNQQTGDITLLKPLDYEQRQNYQIEIAATNAPASSGVPGKVSVNILVTDYNDNCPAFADNQYTKDVTENSMSNSIVFTIQPSDQDATGTLRDLTCTISEPLAQEYFTVTTSGNQCLVLLKKPLDYETNKEFRFALTATNNAGSQTTPCRSSTNLLVNVVDVPDQPIRLDPINYVVNISESALPGSVAVIVKAISSTNDVTYTLLGAANDLQKFNINTKTGEVFLVNPVDREIKDTYLFNVSATDQFSTARGTVRINILDVNDNAPTFGNIGGGQCYQATLSEVTPTNTAVFNNIIATDRDIKNNGQFTYSLLPTSTCHSLTIDETTGAVRTNKLLDFEARDVIHCLVKAEDKGSPSLTGYSCLTLTLSNYNDHKPVFTVDRYNVEIQESAPLNTLVTVVHATDRDGPTVLYRIVSTTPVGAPFRVDNNGKIELVGTLDYEQIRDYTLEIEAFDTGSPTLTSDQNAIVNIKVTAVNDNRPIFGQNYYRITVPENQALNSIVLNVTASDNDHLLSPTHKNLIFSALENTTDFSVESATGSIRVNRKLDFERKRSYSLVVTVRDSANQNQYLSSRAMVDVTIEDINDNRPFFVPTVYNVRVSEKTLIDTTIQTVTAQDADEADNADLRYAITAGNGQGFFALANGNSNKIVLKKELDHEVITQRVFQLALSVTDPRGSAGQNTASVIITVVDINDREAIFDLNYYEADVQENSPNFNVISLLTVRAVDKDSLPENKNLVYSIVDDSEDAKKFRVVTAQGQGLIYAKQSFDYEAQKVYTFLVKASDTARENLTGIAHVTINVLDQNDNTPAVENLRLVYNISETTKVFSTIGIVFATDADTGVNGQLTYNMIENNNQFRIQPNGEIELIQQLDYLQKKQHDFKVIVADRGTPQRQTIVDVTVYVHRTVIAGIAFDRKHYIFNVVDLQNKPLVGTVSARDTGSYVSQSISYVVTAGQSDIAGMFNLVNSSRNGLVTMPSNALPNYDVKNEYTFMVEAINERGAVDFAQVTILVTDTNERSRFIGTNLNGQYEFAISESISVPSYVYGVIVRDDDGGVNADLTYTLTNPIGGNFSIDEYGRIQILEHPDRERQSRYVFTVSVADKSNNPITSTVQVICNVLDYNDNRPIFYPSGIRETTVVEGQQSDNVPILTLFANDTDLGLNRQIVYTSVLPEGHLTVNPNTGAVYVNKAFDYEKGSQYEFVAMVRDSGAPYLSAYQRIRINVINLNDINPYFLQHNYNLTISEVSPIGSTFFKVPAADDDANLPGEIRNFEMTEIPRAGSGAGGADQSFVITSDGWIVVNKKLDYNVQKEFVYTVNVYDKGTPMLNSLSNATVRINLLEHSELQPNFEINSYIRDILENTTIGSPILTVKATSPERLAGKLTYKLVNNVDSTKFILNSDTGLLQSISGFDYEDKRKYSFEVEAKDPVNEKTNRALIIVNILDVNDNVPLFKNNAHQYNISEATRPGQIVTILQATDRDSLDNGRVIFSAISGDTDKFGVNSDGRVILLGALDHRLKNKYEINVMAKDLGRPSLQSTNKVTIYVHKADLKLNTPIFVSHLYKKCVDENSQIPLNVLRVNATNSHPVSGSTITYSIDQSINQAETAPFIINAITGQITLIRSVDYELKKNYDFLVTAVNEEGRQDITVVSVCVNDLNDNGPQFEPIAGRSNISEAAPLGTIVYVMNVVDKDTTVFNVERQYSISSVTGADRLNKFTINKHGVISLAKKIDYEAIRNDPKYILTIVLREGVHTAVGTVTIDVTDWNDNRPTFGQETYTFTVSRQYNLNDVIGVVPALDVDGTTENNQITYSILTTDTHFRMEQQQLVLREQLAYDGERFEFVVMATDNGYLNLRKSALVIVNVADLNNHPPVFAPTNYENTVSEAAPTGTTLIRVYATDKDAYNGARINYVISDNSLPFVINNQGYITLTRPLDYETRNKYVFNVTAVDDGNLASSNYATVTINVVDVNEKTPVFNVKYYEREYPEDTPILTDMLTVQAKDDDGTGNTLTYSLVQQNNDVGSFQIDPNTGVIRLLTTLDYETKKYYTFSVKATDSANKQLSGVAHVTIRVTDVNDNSPQFINYAQYAYNVTVEDNIPVGTLMTVLSTKDADSGNNAVIEYDIVSGNVGDAFTLDQNGQIRLRNPLDADLKNRYDLKVKATDRGTPRLSTQHDVTIHVLKYTESLPVFNPSRYTETVMENIPVGTNLVNLIHTKTKPGSPVTLSFHPHTVYPEFRLNGSRIELNSKLDYERKNLYHMIVLATDETKDVAVAQVTINVLNVNEHAPIFAPNSIIRTISEYSFIGHSILKLSAIDQDADHVHTFRVDGTIPNNYFTLSPTGTLTVARELTPGTYTFDAIANDGLYDSNKIAVTVVVTPETDLLFRNATYYVEVSELIPIGSLMVATNAGNSPSIAYEISSAEVTDTFAINATGMCVFLLSLSLSSYIPYFFFCICYEFLVSFHLKIVNILYNKIIKS